MSLPVPLGVRLYQIVSSADRWVTQWVDDVSFRSVIPGGYASADVTLRVPRGLGTLADPDPLGFSRLSDLFTRVQIVDLRTMEIAWEGRIEDPARQVEPDVWQIGALGSMVAATDIERAVWYADASLDNWVEPDPAYDKFSLGLGFRPFPNYPFDNGSLEKSAESGYLKLNMNGVGEGYVYAGSADEYAIAYIWAAATGYDQYIARFTTTHVGVGPTAAQDQSFSVAIAAAGNEGLDVTAFGAAEITKINVIGTDWLASANPQIIELRVRRNPAAPSWSPPDNAQYKWWARWRKPHVLAVRMDRFGAALNTAADYPGDYVTVSQVVEDVVGRFLVGGWYGPTLNTPWPGSVRSGDVYIDTTDTTQIQNLMWPDGTTAATILNTLIETVQTNAYWAIWESQWGPSNPTEDYGSRHGFRFEWATWPNNWGYLASSADGFEGQPNGEDLANFVFYRYRDSADGDRWKVSNGSHTTEMAPELYDGGFTRAVTVSKEDPTTGATAATLRAAYLNSRKKALNAGTLTVRRPIQFYDSGDNSWSGGARMLDPWMLKPGKLIRITDMPPRTMLDDVRPAPNTPNPGLDGTIFKVVSTDYDSATNTCRLGLDQLQRWQLATQIKKTTLPKRITVVK